MQPPITGDLLLDVIWKLGLIQTEILLEYLSGFFLMRLQAEQRHTS